MKRLALVAAVLAIAACSGGDSAKQPDSTTPAAAVAPAATPTPMDSAAAKMDSGKMKMDSGAKTMDSAGNAMKKAGKKAGAKTGGGN